MTGPVLPQLVVIRKNEFRFEVDNEPFPWRVSERGPTVVQISDELWTVDVEILETHNFTLEEDSVFGWPILDGRHFPWPITAAGFDLHCRYARICTLNLAFYAQGVDTDTTVIARDAEWNHKKKIGLNGAVYQKGDG